MSTVNLDVAINNLRDREKTSTRYIGYINLITESSRGSSFIVEEIKEWAKHKELDAVIWTDLPPNFSHTFKVLNEANVISYLSNLEGTEKDKAENYIRKTPAQIRTNLRNKMEEVLNWTPLQQ